MVTVNLQVGDKVKPVEGPRGFLGHVGLVTAINPSYPKTVRVEFRYAPFKPLPPDYIQYPYCYYSIRDLEYAEVPNVS